MNDSLSRLLVDVCLDAERLDEVRADPGAALAKAGIPPGISELIQRKRGMWISSAVSLTRPVPAAEAIEAWVRTRVEDDPAFAQQIRLEAKPIVERALQIRLPASTVIEVTERDGLPEIRIVGPTSAAPEGRADVHVFASDTDVDIDVDVDTDVDIDVDVDVDIDVDVDVDFGVVVDVDIDVDIDVDTDTVVDNVVDTVTVTQHHNETFSPIWAQQWQARKDMWRAADDRFAGAASD